METRQAELIRVLEGLADELPDPEWVALVDKLGLVVACVPETPAVNEQSISGMTAAIVTMGERVLSEVEGGDLRYTSVAGSKRQYLIVVLGSENLLSIGIRPEVSATSTFVPLRKWVPELLKALQ